MMRQTYLQKCITLRRAKVKKAAKKFDQKEVAQMTENDKTNQPYKRTKPAPIADSSDILQGLPVDDEILDMSFTNYNVPDVVLVGVDSGKKSKGTDVIEP